MKILLYSFDFHPCPGGVNTFVYGLLNGLRARGLKVDFLHSSQINFLPRNVLERVQDFKDSFSKNAAGMPKALTNIEVLRYANRQLLRNIDITRYDIVHSNNGVTSELIHSLYPSIPLLGTIHGNYYRESLFNHWAQNSEEAELFKVYDQYAVDCPTIVHTVSNSMLDNLPLIPSEKHKVIHNFVDVQNFTPTLNSNTPIKIAAAGNLNELKGYDLLLKAVELLKEDRDGVPGFEVTIFGDGPLKNQLNNEARERNLPIKFEGFIERELLQKSLPNYDIFIHPSRFESFGLSVTEAMASGCAVICTDIGGLAEQVKHKDNGLLFQLNNVHDLRNNMERLLKDETLRNHLRRNAVETVKEKFSQEVILDQFVETYQETIRVHKK